MSLSSCKSLYFWEGQTRSPDIHRKCSLMVWLSSWLVKYLGSWVSLVPLSLLTRSRSVVSAARDWIQLHPNPSSSPSTVPQLTHICMLPAWLLSTRSIVAWTLLRARCLNLGDFYVPNYLVPVSLWILCQVNVCDEPCAWAWPCDLLMRLVTIHLSTNHGWWKQSFKIRYRDSLTKHSSENSKVVECSHGNWYR
jgi:hypothetical protein